MSNVPSAPMSKIKLNVFVAEVGFDVAGLFTELINIAMCHVHVFFLMYDDIFNVAEPFW
jgi:hypothetical protein